MKFPYKILLVDIEVEMGNK